ncbi:MAG: shikimate dehydrogenase [Candidatus Bipolaricaulia bacterium]
MLEIDSRTKLLGIIGDPIAHSLSPRMHNFLLHRAGLNYRYLAFRVARERLEGALEGMRSLGIRGLNVTAPHKEQVAPYLDELSKEAQALGAVNTILNDGRRLIGYNTDPGGFAESLRAHAISPEGWDVVILGAGGGAAAVAYALIKKRVAQISIYSRRPARTEALAKRLAKPAATAITAGGLDEKLGNEIAHAQLLINATPVGTSPDDEMAVDPGLLHDGLIVYDLVYNPLKTRLLREAEARGAGIINGLDMLIYQGLESLEIWTGAEFDRAIVPELRAHLQEGVHG